MNDQELQLAVDLSAAFHFRADGPAAPAWLSPAFFTLTGVEQPPPPGWRWPDAIAAADRATFLETWRRAAADGATLDTEVRLDLTGGRVGWHRLRAVLSDWPGPGGRRQWVGVGLDVQERRSLAGERDDALALSIRAGRQTEIVERLKGEFLATASHELRTPLNAIAGWLHVLKLRAQGDVQQLHALAAIERNVVAEKTLIDGLLDVSRLTRGLVRISPAITDLGALVRECVSTMTPAAAAKGVAVRVEAPVEPVLVNGDRSKLEQVVWHLLANAVRFTAYPGDVRVSVARAGADALVRLQDNGEGIDAAFLPYVFEPFGQRPHAASRSGLGLGLTVVRSLVELHGGSVYATSEGIGRGAVFEVTLPAMA